MTSALQDRIAADLRATPQSSPRYPPLAAAMHTALSPAQRDQLRQLVLTGPVYDGDIISKSARDDLITLGLASRAVIHGEQGYTVANYVGWDVYTEGKR